MPQGHYERKPRKWTKEKIHEIALQYESRSDFKFGSEYQYKRARKNGWIDEVCSHMKPKGSIKERHIYAYEFPELKSVYIGLTWSIPIRHNNHERYGTVFEFTEENKIKLELPIDYGIFDMTIAGEKEGEILSKYKKDGWTILNKSTTGSLGGNRVRWTFDKCLEEALKYERRTDFITNSKGAANRVYRMGWQDEIFAHMK